MNLLRGFLGGDVAYAGPFWVIVVITRRCNLRCVGCRFHSPLLNGQEPSDRGDTKDMPLDLFESLCHELEGMGTKSMTITGEGEPLLHPSLPEMISLAKGAGFHVTLVTNGTLLDGKIRDHMVDARLDVVKVSLWAGTPAVYEKVYPGTDPMFFERVVKGLRGLADRKTEHKSDRPHVVLRHALNRTNLRAIDSIVDLAHTTRCDSLSFAPWRTFRGQFDFLSLTAGDEAFLREALPRIGGRLKSLGIEHNIKELLRRYEMGHDAWRKLPCYVPWLHARILVDGTVLACQRSRLSMGNLYDSGLRSIWNGSAYRTFRRKASTLEGLASMGEDCDCNFCGFTMDNVAVHRYFRWLTPYLRGSER